MEVAVATRTRMPAPCKGLPLIGTLPDYDELVPLTTTLIPPSLAKAFVLPCISPAPGASAGLACQGIKHFGNQHQQQSGKGRDTCAHDNKPSQRSDSDVRGQDSPTAGQAQPPASSPAERANEPAPTIGGLHMQPHGTQGFGAFGMQPAPQPFPAPHSFAHAAAALQQQQHMMAHAAYLHQMAQAGGYPGMHAGPFMPFNPYAPIPGAFGMPIDLSGHAQPAAAAPQHANAATSAEAGNEDDEGARAVKRPRLVWTSQLHKRFEEALVSLGDKAVPKTIMREMGVDGLTRENVASHLQKYRLQRKEPTGSNSQQEPAQGEVVSHEGSKGARSGASDASESHKAAHKGGAADVQQGGTKDRGAESSRGVSTAGGQSVG